MRQKINSNNHNSNSKGGTTGKISVNHTQGAGGVSGDVIRKLPFSRQSGAGLLRQIQTLFSPWLKEKEPFWIPDSMKPRLQMKGQALFATRDLPIIPQHTEVYMKEALHWSTQNYLIIGVMSGADQTKEFIYYLLRKPMALFIQRPFVQEEVVGAQRLIDTFINLSLEATGLGIVGARDLFILMDSLSAGSRWSHSPPETEFTDVVWQIGENPIEEALDFLNPKWLLEPAAKKTL